MNRLAIFAEGHTEWLFAERFLRELARKHSLSIHVEEASGGRRSQRAFKTLKASRPNGLESHYVLIVVSGSDERVASDIRDRYDGLVKAGYSAIIAIRDVYPSVSRPSIPALRAGLLGALPHKPAKLVLVLGVMEIETWFISEHSHFLRIHSSLTTTYIRTALGLDPANDDIQLRDHPSADLHNIYRLAGRAYTKRRRHVRQTLDALDYTSLYIELPARLPDLKDLVDHVDAFLAS